MSLPLEPLGLLTLPEARKGFQLGEAARRGGTRQNETDAKRGGREKNGDCLQAPILKTSSALWGNRRMRSTCPTLRQQRPIIMDQLLTTFSFSFR